MLKEFKLQDPGEGIHEVEVQEILVKPGDVVEDGDEAFVVESDKAAIELTSPYNGKVKEIPVKVGDTVRVGETLMTIDTAADSETGKEGQEPSIPGAEEAAEAAPPPEAAAEPPEPAPKGHRPAEPAAASPAERRAGPIKAAPTARKLAKERGIDLARVAPSGSKGHITRADVERHAAGAPAARSTAAEPLPDFSQWGPVRRIPMRSVRKATAEHMAKAWAQIPHVMLEDRIDMTALERFRRRHASNVASKGGRLTRTVFVVKAALIALKEHPRFNASIDTASGEIIEKDYFNIGVAVDSKRGLIVPVIKNADKMSLFELSVALRDIADRTRAGKATPEDLSGGTFSITNIGVLGGTGFFPIINHPEVAVLGLGRGRLEPVIVGNLDHYHVEARYIVPFSLAFDHRVNDGADAARFFNTFRKILSDPEKFVIHG